MNHPLYFEVHCVVPVGPKRSLKKARVDQNLWDGTDKLDLQIADPPNLSS